MITTVSSFLYFHRSLNVQMSAGDCYYGNKALTNYPQIEVWVGELMTCLNARLFALHFHASSGKWHVLLRAAPSEIKMNKRDLRWSEALRQQRSVTTAPRQLCCQVFSTFIGIRQRSPQTSRSPLSIPTGRNAAWHLCFLALTCWPGPRRVPPSTSMSLSRADLALLLLTSINLHIYLHHDNWLPTVGVFNALPR